MLYITLQNPRKFIILTPGVPQTYAVGPPMLFSAMKFVVIQRTIDGADLIV